MANSNLTISPEIFQRFKIELEELNSIAGQLEINQIETEKDISRFSKPLKTVKMIVGDDDIEKASSILQKIQKIRYQINERKIVLISLNQALDTLWEKGMDFLLKQETFYTLKNEALRSSAARELLGTVYNRRESVSKYLEQFNSIDWTLTSNQKAIELQIGLMKERAWNAKRGIE